MSNLIQIKRSNTTAVPGALANGELAFSGNGDVLYIGNFGAVHAIGGLRVPGVLTANQALVANSTSGIDEIRTAKINVASFNITSIIDDDTFTTGVANTSLATSESIKAYVDTEIGAIVSEFTLAADSGANDTFLTGQTLTFAGNTGITTSVANNLIDIDLDDTAVTPGSYGDANTTTTFTVDQQGRLTAAGQTDINHDTLLNFVADEHVAHSGVDLTAGAGLTGGGTIDVSRTFNIGQGNGMAVDADLIRVVPGTGVVSNTTGVHIGQPVGTTDDVTFNDIIATGNLTINGTLTTIDTNNMIVEDSLIKLAKNNSTTDTLDIGIYGLYDTSGSQDLYAGVFRDATDGNFKFFKDLQVEPTTTVNTAGAGYTRATIDANFTGGTIASLSAAIAVGDGGTGLTALANESILKGTGGAAMEALAVGTSGQVLQVNVSGDIEWNSLDGGTF
jgi:hypothetical protein